MSDGRTEAGGHTAGPWEWCGDNLTGGELGFTDVICLTDDGKPYGLHSPVLLMDNEAADRALIARAPDLLAENERLRAALGEMMDHLCGFNPCSQWEYIWEGVQHARESGSAALARTGKDGG